MSWWGKAIGGAFGYMLGGPLGALLGAVLGHNFDRGIQRISYRPWETGDQERVQAAFFTATFTVSENLMEQMRLDDVQRKVAIDLFNQGKNVGSDIEGAIEQLRMECGRRLNLIQFFIEIQIATALADGDLHPEEQKILVNIAEQLGFSRFKFERLLAMAVAQARFRGFRYQKNESEAGFAYSSEQQVDEAYRLLGVEPSVSDVDLKRAYRRLMSQNHPDKLVSKGLPEEMMKLATEKTGEIKTAYEFLKGYRQEIR